MAGINQLPAGSEGIAAFVLIYTSASWVCSVLLIWCARLYRESWSYISILAYFCLISNTASIVQQCHDITYYRDIVTAEFDGITSFTNNPELAIANGSFGLDLVLYYIQYYSYNVEAMVVMFWAFELAQSVYGLSSKPHLRPLLRKVNSWGKAVAVLFPLVTILLLRAPSVQQIFVLFILLADLPLMISLAISSTTMIAILIRYVQSRKRFSDWTPQGNSTAISNETSTETVQTSRTGTIKSEKRSLYDRWLMVRFTVAFVVLAIFEVTNTLFQLQSVANNRKDATLKEPDLSADRANTSLFLFMPGVTPGIFVFLVFGTTSGCRGALREIFLGKPRQTRGVEGGRRGWQRWGKRPSGEPTTIPTIPAQTTKDPFADSSEVGSRDEDPTQPMPIATLVSRYNKTYNASHDAVMSRPPSIQSQLTSSVGRGARHYGLGDDSDAIQLRSLSSMEQVREEYYRSNSSEHSDDSGPILPIMSPHGRRQPRSHMAMPIAGGRWSAGAGQR